MFDLSSFLLGLSVVLPVALGVWGLSVYLSNVSIVDSLWSVMFMLLAIDYALATGTWGPRTVLTVALVSTWAIRLSVYITWRNWGHGEDRRYQAIRARNEPKFWLKSLYLVFLLQAVMAWVISLPLHAAIVGDGTLVVGDWLGAALWLVGFVFEAGGDWQLRSFKSDPANRNKVMDRGFWRFTRHPNYFGEFCMWWGFYVIAVSAGGWWAFVGPALMTVLLLKVSGVTLLEKDIGERRPEYKAYIRRTNAFFPGLPKSPREGSGNA